ncbi:MazG-like family protein [Streptomyces sp. NPDC057702]|uniref:MazG-like family protein n=1 Tax=unclassified Streptomyces TaxID=2593676 RepID=UPI00367CEB38
MTERVSADQIRADQLDALHERAARARQPADGDLWEAAREAVAWLDAANAPREPGQETTLRLLKLAEETGEVMNAYIGLTGQNPRKGVTHGRDEVAAELCDVILTAAVALHAFSDDPAATLAAHVRDVTRRTRTGEGA